MSGLKPFWTFYGGKFRSAPRYPTPTHKRIIEPFAGAAGYSVRNHELAVTLVEKDPEIAALWRWLIGCDRTEIDALPLMEGVSHVDELDVRPEAKSLIGFWLNKGAAQPCKKPSAWMRQGYGGANFWGEVIRERIASQVESISHWNVIEGDYSLAPDVEATWFIDPPYEAAGKYYRHSAKNIDFPALGDWCRARQGQVMVCENDGAEWLPFRPFMKAKANESRAGGKISSEAIWISPQP